MREMKWIELSKSLSKFALYRPGRASFIIVQRASASPSIDLDCQLPADDIESTDTLDHWNGLWRFGFEGANGCAPSESQYSRRREQLKGSLCAAHGARAQGALARCQ